MKQIIFVLGGPGSGKGTQCKLLEEKFGYKHISAGDLLRNEKSKDTENAKLINNLITNGKIVPSHITINLILDEIDSCDSNIILLDGFPRNMENLETWNSLNKHLVSACLFFDCQENILINRLLNRGKTSNRIDDNLETIKKRLVTYHESTQPVINYFKTKNLIYKIDTNRDVDIIYGDISNIILDL